MSTGYGRGAVGGGTLGGLEGGAGKEGMGGGREKAGGLLALPVESARGGGLLDVGECFCILKGPTVGVLASVSYRRKSSSSGLPCLRPSILVRRRQVCAIAGCFCVPRQQDQAWSSRGALRDGRCLAAVQGRQERGGVG